MAEIVAMRITGVAQEGFTSAAIQWGIDHEMEARVAYELESGNLVDQEGWIPHHTIEWTGCSPDGLIDSDGLVEIKCPNTATHIDYLLADEAPAEYHLQMLWQMEVTGRNWCDFVSYDPRLGEHLQLFVKRFYRDDKRLDDVRAEVIRFLNDTAEMVEKLQSIAERKK